MAKMCHLIIDIVKESVISRCFAQLDWISFVKRPAIRHAGTLRGHCSPLQRAHNFGKFEASPRHLSMALRTSVIKMCRPLPW